MPIKHIQTKIQNVRFIQPIYPKFGSIGMGKMAVSQKSGNPYPTETPHYVFSFEQGYEDLAPFVSQLYGNEPMSLDVVFMPMTNDTNPLERFMPNSMQAWTKSKFDPNKRTLTVECDGENVMRVFDYQTKRHVWQPEHACGYDDKKGECAHGCKPTARLRLGLPALYQELGVKGYFEMTLHGVDSIKNLLVALGQAKNNIGDVVWRMTRAPKTISYTDSKDQKVKERTYHPIASIKVIGAHAETPMITSTPRPALADVNTSSDYDDSGVYEDDNTPPLPELTPVPVPTQSLAQLVVAYIHDKGYTHVQASDVLTVLGYTSWDDLRERWHGERTQRAIAEEFIQYTTQAF
jgi:hypothetical protein